MRYFLNNCRRRPHAEHYGTDAFYDLNHYGRQAEMALDIRQGDECVVATPDRSGNVVFSWFTFSREKDEANPTEAGKLVRVFYGKRKRAVQLPKARAAATAPYSVFFDRLGRFKRPSVI